MTAPTEFAQPDLRSKDRSLRGSVYQHPHTADVVPSVTTISGLMDKPHLVAWSAKLAAEWAADNFDTLVAVGDRDARVDCIKRGADGLRSEGRDLGSLAHNTIEALTLGEMSAGEVDPSVMHHVMSWLEWCDRFVVSFLLVEATVWSHAHRYAGTLDLVALFKDGRNVLVDYKTGRDVYPDAALQLTALRRADVIVDTDGERPLPRIDGAGLLHLPAPVMTPTGRVSVRGKWSWREVATRDSEWETFLALRRAYDWEHGEAKTVLGGKQTSPVVTR